MSEDIHTDQADELQLKQAKAVANAVFNLWPAFLPQGFPSETIFEGVINGAGAAIMAERGMNRFEFADLLSDIAELYRAPDPKRGKLHAVE